ncbi:MAG: serine--pyruvate aminotransferase [Acidobacteria bacterium]|jgi:short-chain fatty acids transporter|nr:serine--pyruvate aminotransferase [Acidobacteriota bacterium]
MMAGNEIHSGKPGKESLLSRIALRFTAFTEKWMPDAFGFVLVGTIIVLLLGMATGETPTKMVDSWGKGFWSLIPFTLQMAMIIVGGYAVATSGLMARLISRLARIPSTPRTAIVLTAFVSMITSYLNWAFSLIFTAIMAKEIARKVPRTDYRALSAMSFIGLGTVWAQGLSGSAALQVANRISSPEAIQEIIAAGRGGEGIIPLSKTIFLWQSFVCVLILMAVVLVLAWFMAPSPERSVSAKELGINIDAKDEGNGHETGGKPRPGDFIERSPFITLLILIVGIFYLVRHFSSGPGSAFDRLDLNTINMILLLLGLLLHWRPYRMAQAIKDGSPSAAGVLLQYPLYGGIFGMIVYTGLSERIANLLVSVANATFYPAMISLYSFVLGIFVPSAGSKWVIEAPYVIGAANKLMVNQGWMVVVYDLGEASANLVQPFWMIPILAILGLKARDIMGYTFAFCLICFPVVLLLTTIFAKTLSFP